MYNTEIDQHFFSLREYSKGLPCIAFQSNSMESYYFWMSIIIKLFYKPIMKY